MKNNDLFFGIGDFVKSGTTQEGFYLDYHFAKEFRDSEYDLENINDHFMNLQQVGRKM